MQCDEIRRWISPHLDSELDPHTNFEIAQHLDGCAACRQAFEAERQLETSVAASLSSDPQTEAAWDQAVHRAIAGSRSRPRRWQLAVAAVALFVGLVGGWRGWTMARQDLVRTALRNHQEYLANRMTLDVQSGAPQTAEAFFVNKLPFPVRCPRNLTDQGIRLIGARLCHLNHVPVAYILYHVDSRPISVFLLDADSLGQFRQAAETLGHPDAPRGYRVGRSVIVTARSALGVICAVGEVPQATLERIVDSYASEST